MVMEMEHMIDGDGLGDDDGKDNVEILLPGMERERHIGSPKRRS
jgi:hypothetical protein